MCMIHKSEYWLGDDTNPGVYKLASLEKLIRISCFYDSEVHHWFHSYFERFVYAYWEELDLQRTTDWDLNRGDQKTKIIPLVKVLWKDQLYEEVT